MKKQWKCPYCESTERYTNRAPVCKSNTCFELHTEQRKRKDLQWRKEYMKTDAYAASKKRDRLQRKASGYSADKRYASTAKAKLLKKVRRDTKRYHCTWNSDEGCILTGKYKGLPFADVEDIVECDHFLSLASLHEAGLLEVSASPINLAWVDKSANRSKRNTNPVEFIAANGASPKEIRMMRARVFVVLQSLIELATMTGDAKYNAYRIFGIEEMAAALER